MKILYLLALIIPVIGFFLVKKSNANETLSVGVPRMITLNDLADVMQLLMEEKLEYDFFGITSNGIDCVYFVRVDKQINIEFEVMIEEQKVYFEKIKAFGESRGFEVKEITYGNKPKYSGVDKAPVVAIISKADIQTSVQLGKELYQEIFNSSSSTQFEVVP